ncbi:tRNA/rRNA methyltransferase SpoU [Penicillium brevicompactum]|uniref:rRNA methyltransferase 1, mitochondrial n=1 Tax=Penicillium brevicompactum TaxID=5074 RepID=A0A9W9UMK7_PENBR|nr:tRNA/rRNA methyltransferase SpoU [Penicillium brevicompactum]
MMLNIISRASPRASHTLGTSHLSLKVRNASLNSAIGRGIRRSQANDGENRHGNTAPRRGRQYEGQYAPRQYGKSNDTSAARNSRPKYAGNYGGRLSDKLEESSLEQTFGNGHKSQQPRGDKRERKYENQPTWLNSRSNRRQDEQRPGNASRPFGRERHERPPTDAFDEDEFIRSGNFRALPREHQLRFPPRSRDSKFSRPERESPQREEPREKPSKSRAHRVTEKTPERVKENVKVPDTIPYTTPASEFIYGTSAVEAALRCSRRQIYKLYVYQGAEEELNAAKVTIRKIALSKNIAVKMAFGGWDRLMDKMSAGRPHNGCILEASPLPKLPVRAFHAVPSISEEYFRAELAPQSREEAAVNGTDDRIPIHHPSPPPREDQPHRYPVALLLDGVVDPGNMGAIIRSSYFLGIDAIVLAGRNSAPLSPVTIKASAGAAENMPILQVKNEIDFIQRSKENGWRFYAADAPGPDSVYLNHIAAEGDLGGEKLPVATGPSVVMMGSEGSGLSSHIKSHANATVSIPGARHTPGMGVASDPARIDSLNVSVAAALLMEKFLRTPLAVAETVKKERKPTKEKMW